MISKKTIRVFHACLKRQSNIELKKNMAPCLICLARFQEYLQRK